MSEKEKILIYMLAGYCSHLFSFSIDAYPSNFNFLCAILLALIIPFICLYKTQRIFIRKTTTFTQRFFLIIVLIAHWIYLCLLSLGVFLSFLIPTI